MEAIKFYKTEDLFGCFSNFAAYPITLKGNGFQHPIDLGDLKAVTCTDCHTGGVSP